MSVSGQCGMDIALVQARAGLDRLTPAEAYEAVRAGAVLVDIRPEQTRAIEGTLPSALVIDRTLRSRSPARHRCAGGARRRGARHHPRADR